MPEVPLNHKIFTVLYTQKCRTISMIVAMNLGVMSFYSALHFLQLIIYI